MFKFFRSLFRPVKVRYLKLDFLMDSDESGRHHVKVYLRRGEKKHQIKAVDKLWDYGFTHEQITHDSVNIWKVREQDRQILQALKSLNPEILDDGTLVFEIQPPILNYVRLQPNILETDQSKQTTISNEPLIPTAKASFDPTQGLELQMGYRVEDNGPLLNPEELTWTANSSHVRIKNTFFQIHRPGEKINWLMGREKKVIPTKDIVDFLKHQKPVIESQAKWEMDRDHPVYVDDKPIEPVARINYEPQIGLKIETGFVEGDVGDIHHLEDLRKSADDQYILLGNTFHRLPKLSPDLEQILKSPFTSVPDHQIPEFFQRDLVLISEHFNAVLTDLAKQIRVVTDPMEPYIQVAKDNQGWLDFSISYNKDDINLPLDFLLKRKGSKFVQVDPHTWVKVDSDRLRNIEKQLVAMGAVKHEGNYRLPIREFASLEEFVQSIGGVAVLSQAYQDFLDQLTGFKADEKFQLPEKIEKHLHLRKRDLRPYQRAGIHWLNWLRTNHLHGILADDMGLGKTLQSLCVLYLAYDQTGVQQHSLVIAPKSVLQHWEAEIRRVFPIMRTHIYHGPNRRKNIFKSSLPYIFITTYETISRDINELSKIPFYYLILDEASKIKNPDSRRTQSIKALNAVHRIALSGTPVENRPAELWSLYDFLMRGHLGQYGTFIRVYEDQILAGNLEAARRLGRRVSPFLLRRKKTEVAKDLPEKIILSETCVLTAEQRQLYGTLQDTVKGLRSALIAGQYVNYTTSILPVLIKLKQICDHPALISEQTKPIRGRSEKFDWILDKIEEILEIDEQVVVFSHFLGMLDLLEASMIEADIAYIRIDGSTNNRQELIDRFDHGGAKVALLSLMAAGYGINLTGANHVIHCDRWWNPAVEDQATDRVHRIGQLRTVFVYYIINEGTLEEKIVRLLEKKRGIADKIVDAAQEGPRQWTKEELIELLKPLD